MRRVTTAKFCVVQANGAAPPPSRRRAQARAGAQARGRARAQARTQARAGAGAKPADDDDDMDDMFGDDDEDEKPKEMDENPQAEGRAEARLAKKEAAQKSMVVIEVKPEADQDLARSKIVTEMTSRASGRGVPARRRRFGTRW